VRIGYFIAHFPYEGGATDKVYFRGGAIRAAHDLASCLVDRGHDIAVFTSSINRRDSVEKRTNMTVYRYGTDFRILSSNFALGMFWKPLRIDVDIVHAHFSVPPSTLAAMRYAKRKKIPMVLTYHGDWQESWGNFVRRWGLSCYNKFLLDRILSFASVIISPSEYYIDESRFLAKHRNKIMAIPNGINIEDFEVPYSKEECRKRLNLPINANIILFVGALTPYKGPEVLVKAMPRILEAVANTELVYVGDGLMRSELAELSRRLKVEINTKFVGFVGDIFQKVLYYKSADVFVLPSTMNTEVFPLVLLEASAAGLPMVVSDLQTFRCIVNDGSNGIVTERRNEAELAEAILYLLKNKDARQKMSNYAREYVKRFTWDKIAERTEQVYKDVLSKK